MKKFIIVAGAVYIKTAQKKLKEVCTLQDSGELMSVYREDFIEPSEKHKSYRLLFVRLPKRYNVKFLVFLTAVPRSLLEDNLIEIRTQKVESMADEYWFANKIELLEDCVRIIMPDGTPVSFIEKDDLIAIV